VEVDDAMPAVKLRREMEQLYRTELEGARRAAE
jgi:hypothetical protein